MSNKKISVILCHHKGRLIDDAIKSLNDCVNRKDFEVIVMTSDVTYKHCLADRLIFQEGGPDVKRNIGFKFAQGSYIAFFDDDIEVQKHAVLEMEKLLDEPCVGMVFGKLLNMEHRNRFDEAGSYLTTTGFLWSRAESHVEDTGQYEEAVPILAGKSAACMIRRNLFVKTGKFDVSFGILGEETDLAWRVWLCGFKVMYCPQSVTYHAFNTKFKPADFYTPDRVYFNGCKNYIMMLVKNLETINLWRILPVHILIWIVSAFAMLFGGRVRAFKLIFKALFHVFTHWNLILNKRAVVQKTRQIKDKDLFKFILKSPKFSYYLERLKRYVQVGLHG